MVSEGVYRGSAGAFATPNFFDFLDYIALIIYYQAPKLLEYLATVPLMMSTTPSPTISPPTPTKSHSLSPGHCQTISTKPTERSTS